MKLIIGKPLSVQKLNHYKFEVEFMHGDADAETYPTAYIHKDAKWLNLFAEYVASLKSDKENMEWEEFADPEKEGVDWDDKNFPEFYIGSDVTDMGGSRNQASFVKHKITFTDENGIEYEVKLKN